MAIDNPFYTKAVQGRFRRFDLGDFTLEERFTLPGCKLAYKTFGKLSAAKDNAILIQTWYSGTHKVWRDEYIKAPPIGPAHALNPAEYFIVVANQIGNGLSTSPHNTTGSYSMGRFPHVSIGDSVRAQEKLLREKFGIEELQLVIGGSVGAAQAYEWAVRFPSKVKRAAAIAGTAKTTPHTRLLVDALIGAITSDPGFKDGYYSSNEEVREGLARHAKIWSVVGFSTEFFKQKHWRKLGEPP